MAHVTLASLAEELGLDRSNMRKYILKHGFAPVTVRTPESRSQLTLALTQEDAEAVRALRQSHGFSKTQEQTDMGMTGAFYIVQVVPEFAPNRIKLGFATDAVARLSSHRTAAPTAQLVKVWPCQRSWEACAIASITRAGCRLIANEVYECDDLQATVDRGAAFFAVMPNP